MAHAAARQPSTNGATVQHVLPALDGLQLRGCCVLVHAFVARALRRLKAITNGQSSFLGAHGLLQKGRRIGLCVMPPITPPEGGQEFLEAAKAGDISALEPFLSANPELLSYQGVTDFRRQISLQSGV